MNTNTIVHLAAAAILAMLLGPPAALAQGAGEIDWRIRGFYGVVGLNPGDTLNIREKSSARAGIVGELPPGTIVFATGRWHQRKGSPWYQINHNEGLAWVSAAYLRKSQVLTIGTTRAPVAGSCGGFEPGWNAKWDRNGLEASDMAGPVGTARFSQVITPLGAPTPSVIEFTNGPENLRMTLVLQDQQCEALPVDSDSYQTGLLLVEKGNSLIAYSGCCNPAPGAIAPGN